MKKSFATLVSKQPLQGLRHQNELSTAGQKYSVFGEKVTDFLGKIHAKKQWYPICLYIIGPRQSNVNTHFENFSFF